MWNANCWHAMGVDINPDALMVAHNSLDFTYGPLDAVYVLPEMWAMERRVQREHEVGVYMPINFGNP